MSHRLMRQSQRGKLQQKSTGLRQSDGSLVLRRQAPGLDYTLWPLKQAPEQPIPRSENTPGSGRPSKRRSSRCLRRRRCPTPEELGSSTPALLFNATEQSGEPTSTRHEACPKNWGHFKLRRRFRGYQDWLAGRAELVSPRGTAARAQGPERR